MGKGFDSIRIHRPHTVREVMAIRREHPGTVYVAGGTDLMRKRPGDPPPAPPGELISLADVDELGKIKRKENTVEIGAAVPLERIVSLGEHIVPPLLLRVLSRIGGPSLRNLATLGGNVCLASPFSDALLPLLLFDARCEVRRLNAHAWIPLARLLKGPGKTSLDSFELLASISLPIPTWTIRTYAKLELITRPALSLCKFAGAARIYRSTVTDFRVIWGGVDPLYVRNREIEALVIGAKLPFAPKLRSQLADRFQEIIDAAPPSFLPEKYHRRSAVRLALAFLDDVSAYREA